MANVRIGIVGLGAMGNFHVSYLHEVRGAFLTAGCGANAEKA